MIMSFQQLVSGVGIYYALNEPSVRKNEGKMGRHKKPSDQNPNGQSGVSNPNPLTPCSWCAVVQTRNSLRKQNYCVGSR